LQDSGEPINRIYETRPEGTGGIYFTVESAGSPPIRTPEGATTQVRFGGVAMGAVQLKIAAGGGGGGSEPGLGGRCGARDRTDPSYAWRPRE
jgi:hypothetical protein